MMIHADIDDVVFQALFEGEVHSFALFLVHRILVLHQRGKVHPMPHRFAPEIVYQRDVRFYIPVFKRRAPIGAPFQKIAHPVKIALVPDSVFRIERNFLGGMGRIFPRFARGIAGLGSAAGTERKGDARQQQRGKLSLFHAFLHFSLSLFLDFIETPVFSFAALFFKIAFSSRLSAETHFSSTSTLRLPLPPAIF